MEEAGRCLRCNGVMFLDEPTQVPPTEADAAPPVPNGLEDDAET
jgi:hypothetical protein